MKKGTGDVGGGIREAKGEEGENGQERERRDVNPLAMDDIPSEQGK